MLHCLIFIFFFFNDTATTEIYTLSLHDALPISATMVGMVYKDLNGNGQRDAGEPAVTGALVRRDGESVITDANGAFRFFRSEEHTSELQSQSNLVCRLLLEKKKKNTHIELSDDD